MYVVPLRQGQTAIRGRSFDVNKNVQSLTCSSFVASFKNISEVRFCTFFMVYYMYISLGQRQTVPRGQHFDVNKKALSLYPFVTIKKNLFEV